MAERLKELNKLGQSIWYDNIQRSMFSSGQFEQLISAGIQGMTSNPSIFDKAISGSTDYDPRLKELYAAGLDIDTIYEKLVLEDIASAADLLSKVYERTEGLDGYISLEVRPTLAMDTENTIIEARRLFKTLNRPNIMIKVPATPQGIPAIKTLTAEGININVTLIFSIKQYEKVAAAYLAGLEERLASGGNINHIASVASFFVSRVDTAVDRELQKVGNTALQGKIGVANSKAAYINFHQIFSGQRWEKLKSAGARVQRPLWASTSTKNPAYPDTLYVDNLIGPHTVNTVPPAALDAFIDHGQAKLTLEEDTGLAITQLEELNEIGIDLIKVTQDLQDEGVAAFEKSFLSLMENLSQKVSQLQNDSPEFSAELGEYQDRVEEAMQVIVKDKVLKRIWEHDYTLWKPEPAEITNRLGWLDIGERMKSALPELDEFVSEVRQAGFKRVLLLGMGGSSLAPEVFRDTFGVKEGYLDLAVLDSTDPDAIAAQAAGLDLAETLFVVSTKSGGTVETISFFKYFYNQVAAALGDEHPGSHFIAITDAGSQLDQIASQYSFRRTFHNDPNIGGRYSALSYFGLVPAALIGMDLEKLLERTASMDKNNAAYLGAAMGELAQAGRDKLTLLISPGIASFGNWVEQLIAESTGKESRGILPVVAEPVNRVRNYSDDRLFIYLKLKGDTHYDDLVTELEQAGNPVIRMQMDDIYDLGQQMFLWELATAVAGTRLGINPFDQPNVESAKILARKMVSSYQDRGELPALEAAEVFDGITGYHDRAGIMEGATSARQLIDQFLAAAKTGAYIVLQAYIQPTPGADQALQALRAELRDETRLATTLGYGPRFLHSTGQLHKGDAGLGMFIQLTSQAGQHIPIPDEPGSDKSGIDFGTLKQAQSLGDRQALLDANRRVLRLDLDQDPIRSIKSLTRTGD
jgi:transaldolase/glucose-6-phosphate isomerase